MNIAAVVASLKDRQLRLIMEKLLSRGILPNMLAEDYYTEDEIDAIVSGLETDIDALPTTVEVEGKIRTVKFTNGTLLRTLDTASYTINNLADILYTLAYDNKLTGTISGWTATASATYTFDLTSFTANTLAAFLATVINDIQTNGYLSVSLYRCTTPRGRFALDCDSFTMNQLGQAVCAFMAELGVSGLEIGLATKQPLSTDLTAIAALTSAADKTIYSTGAGTWATTTLTSFARTLIDDASASAARTTLGLGTMAVEAASTYATVASIGDYGGTNFNSDVYHTGLFSLIKPRIDNGTATPNDTDTIGPGDGGWVTDFSHLFIDASALGGAGNANVRLPDPSDYLAVHYRVSISVPGSGADTITVECSTGNVNGSTYVMDATGYSFATFSSDGSNWFRIG